VLISSRLILLWLVAGALITIPTTSPAQHVKVGSGVQPALDTQGSVRVLVALKTPARKTASRSAKKASVRAMQDQVLGRMAEHEFEMVHQYEILDAMAVWVTLEGLERLLADPNVARVDLDAPGFGELA
jgi:hypothetical protein